MRINEKFSLTGMTVNTDREHDSGTGDKAHSPVVKRKHVLRER